eukprot:11273065-Alexandrium_andersonii.AAC.1
MPSAGLLTAPRRASSRPQWLRRVLATGRTLTPSARIPLLRPSHQPLPGGLLRIPPWPRRKDRACSGRQRPLP